MSAIQKTVAEIKSELNSLGVKYRSSLRKAELAELLEKSTKQLKEEQYSPPYTRRRTMQIRTSVKLENDVLLSDSSPGNPASAILQNVSSQESSDDDDESETESSKSRSSSDSAEKKVIVAQTPTVKPRRSMRLTPKHINNSVKIDGVLFSDDEIEKIDEPDVILPSKEEEIPNGKTSVILMWLLAVIIVAVVLLNALAYTYYTYPSIFKKLSKKVLDFYHTLISPFPPGRDRKIEQP